MPTKDGKNGTRAVLFDFDGTIADTAADLARDTVARLDAIDALIAETAERWRPERMAILDRLVLRMATCEMIRDRSTPPAIIINEALELARSFGAEASVKFVNGMLDAIRKKIESQTAQPS